MKDLTLPGRTLAGVATGLAGMCLLLSCVTAPPQQQPVERQVPAVASEWQGGAPPSEVVEPAERPRAAASEPESQIAPPATDQRIRKGTGVFVRPPAAAQEPADATGDVTLNFEDASLREFVRVIFEDVLKENYLIDAQVKGQVTLHTSTPVTREAVLPILESVLQSNGAALVYDQDVYRVIPLETAQAETVSPAVGSQAARRPGYGIQIVPLKHVAAPEIEKILKPFVPNGSTVAIDKARNLLVISGPQYRVKQLIDTVDIFDVDWLKGMSFGFFKLQYADAATLVTEIQQVIGADAETPLAGLVRLIPIQRLNAVLVITHAPRYMDDMAELIDQFDMGVEGAPGRRLYVYHLENGKAENLAAVLQEIFGLGGGTGTREPAPTAAIMQTPPGQGANVFQTAEAISQPPPPVAGGTGAGGDYPRDTPLTGPEAGRVVPSSAPSTEPAAVEGVQSVSIIADRDNNALLVMASARDYRAIEAVIRKLDMPPRQVLIDATIAEVTLSEGLDFGVRWFLRQNNLSLGFNAPVPQLARGDGLALAVFKDNGNAQLFIDTLASRTAVKFLSAPQVMVLDNQTANIRVGDQIPVTVRSSQSTLDPEAPIVSEVQFRDTGTLLSVTPRINAGGKVTLEISQEVSLPGSEPAVGGGGNVAISQRTIDSSVVIQSGETVVLGGLILETRSEGESGVPLLKDIPWLGRLFKTTSEDTFRTELIVMITPQVVEDENDAAAITDELRKRMQKPVEYQRMVKPM